MNGLTPRVKRAFYPLVRAGLEHGLPPSWLRYESVLEETVPEYFARSGREERNDAGAVEVVHPENRETNQLPRNVADRNALPTERGWWGYSFWDVPTRVSAETRIVSLPDCCIVPQIDAKTNEFWVAILNEDRRALRIREMRFGDRHADVLRSSKPSKRVKRATWILERVYHNHSHWLTAHLPKLLLLDERNGLDNVHLPRLRTPVIDSSLRMIGLEPDAFPTFDPERPLLVDELTLVETDRFRPELLRSVRTAFEYEDGGPPHRRLYVSREKASRRRLVNEDAIWPLLEAAGFERVYMEDLTFGRQVEMMREASIVAAPHGAGLTNVLFCAPGTHVVEIADLSFPNPNFYALASALGHHYWIVPAEGLGDAHPLDRDMRVEPSDVAEVLARLSDERGSEDIQA